MEIKRFWASIGISTGLSLTIFGVAILLNHWGPTTGWFVFLVGIFLFIASFFLALQWERAQKTHDKK
jgi:hypothetical protein